MKEICEYLFSQSNSEINHKDPIFETWIKPIDSENTNYETKENDVENYNKENETKNDEKEDN